MFGLDQDCVDRTVGKTVDNVVMPKVTGVIEETIERSVQKAKREIIQTVKDESDDVKKTVVEAADLTVKNEDDNHRITMRALGDISHSLEVETPYFDCEEKEQPKLRATYSKDEKKEEKEVVLYAM